MGTTPKHDNTAFIDWIKSQPQPETPTRRGPRVQGLTTKQAARLLAYKSGQKVTRDMVKNWTSGRVGVPVWIMKEIL